MHTANTPTTAATATGTLRSGKIRTDWIPGIHSLPILHGSMEMARVTIQVIREVQPDIVLLEFPSNLDKLLHMAAARLPSLSVAVSPPRKTETETRPVYFLIEPVDPICAAAWFCYRNKIPFHAIDRGPDPNYPPVPDLLPDPASIESLGYNLYVELAMKSLEHRSSANISSTLPPLSSEALSSILSRDLLEREKKDSQREMCMVWRIQQEVSSGRRVLLVCGLAHLEGIGQRLKTPILAQPLPERKNPQAYLAQLDPDCLSEVLSEIPAVEGLWAQAVQDGEEFSIHGEESPLHGEKFSLIGEKSSLIGNTRLDYQARLLDLAVRDYRETWHETLSSHQIQTFNRYAGSYAREQGRLILDHYGLLVAARNCLGETFSYVLYQKSGLYPFNRADGLPELYLKAEDLQLASTRIKFCPRTPKKEKKGFVRRKIRDFHPESWQNQALLGECSHCPEDQQLNAFTDSLCEKATGLLNKNVTRVEPFTTTLGQGIDIRETLRHWKTRQIYIRREVSRKAAVTSVVAIFHESYKDHDFPYLRTWTRERWEEVERAFYATSPLDHPVGPQIFRCEYGGFLASYNRPGLSDIWVDTDFSVAASYAERLLLAGAAYSNEKTIIFIAPSPPRKKIVRICEYMDKRVIYSDLNHYSKQYLDRLRFFHVLGNRMTRKYAEDYIHPLRID